MHMNNKMDNWMLSQLFMAFTYCYIINLPITAAPNKANGGMITSSVDGSGRDVTSNSGNDVISDLIDVDLCNFCSLASVKYYCLIIKISKECILNRLWVRLYISTIKSCDTNLNDVVD